MSCHEIQSWTFSGLVGAFLDLAIAYLLLCASTLAYLASKFLGLFGLALPCPCNGLFGDPNSDSSCWQSVLVDSPSGKISSVQFSVKSKLPFDSIWEEERFDIKGKGVSSQRARHALRRRRKCLTDNGGSSSVSSYDPSRLDSQAAFQSPASASKLVHDSIEGSTIPDGNSQLYGRVSSVDMDLLGGESPDFESNAPINENELTQKDALPADNLNLDAQGEGFFDSNDKSIIRVLKQALEKEHAACTALYLELEKERSAAATAADEAMAMILRLQEEKALIEMEARQYQRMIEEKSAYDFEEMSILKEILIRREREKHFLEKEVETYRQMIFGSEQFDSDQQDIGTSRGRRAASLLHSGESICGKEKMENANKISEDRSIELQDRTLTFGKKLPNPDLDEVDSLKLGSSGNREIDEEFGEMEPLSLEKSPMSQEGEAQYNFSIAETYNLQDEKTVTPFREVQQQIDVTSASHESASKTIQAGDETKNFFSYTCDDSEKQDEGSCNTMFNKDPFVPDVRMIDDKFSVSGEVRGNGSEKLFVNAALDIPRSCDSPNMSRSQTEQDVRRSCSDITSGFSPMDCSLRKPMLSDFRRNSMSIVDYERFKIDNEVGRLRERLRIVQEGRGKLNVSTQNMEKEKTQLQLLENIMGQLQEIRQLTEPGKAFRQVSLPPQSCKIMSKKRHWRSVSLEVRRST
ncbi:myosin-binding protein 7 isoform X1 [Jatropha curcas]|uniref:myosin-binding protein 7 isoform X1 n=1 Tax=Jatropha curcas TaxID=180498 RepID=UPI0005FB12CA|nr:myosin-binding protein 7 isoform X1 [Jatropha curcas]XP_037492599.1 myosin-binding protein 7 isoform X1 [Jatropha curcas]